jgi:hypothetical protein
MCRSRCGVRLLAAILSLAAGYSCANGDEKDKDKPAEKMSGWQRLFRKQAAGYKFVVERDGGADVQLVAEPILQWSQPVRGGADGAVFLWTQEGQPIAIGTFFIWPVNERLQGVTHELHSLSQHPLIAEWRDRRWTPPKDSIVWKPVPEAPKPGLSAEQRLRQMRDLARQFSAESHDKNDRKWDLRLLPRPIYRFDIDTKSKRPIDERDVLDGALFGFVEGTDLEIVLSIRAAKTETGHRWEYALARMSDFRLAVRHRDITVWEVDRASFDNPTVAYYCSTVETRISADDEPP